MTNHTLKALRGDLLGVLFALVASVACFSCMLQVEDEHQSENTGEVSLAIAASCNINAAGTDIWISPNGSDSNPGTFALPKKRLQDVHDTLIGTPPTTHYTIHVDGGLYRAQKVDWSRLSSTKNIVIEACPGAIPIFDGLSSALDTEPEAYFFKVDPTQNGNTNVTLRNLTVRNYYQHGIALNDGGNGLTTGNNRIEGCTLEVIGSKEFPGAADEDGDPDGISAINAQRSSNNYIGNNRFVAIEDEVGEDPKLHAIYFAHGSVNNSIVGNSFDTCSGDPIKFRDGSNNNVVRDNSFNRCGDKGIINVTWNGVGEDEEARSTGNVACGNVATFPHALAVRKPLDKCVTRDGGHQVPCDASEVDFDIRATDPEAALCNDPGTNFDLENFFVLSEPEDEQIVGIVGGDFDSDGRSEILVAFNYDGQDGFAKIVSTAGAVDNRHLHKVIYANNRWNVNAMSSCDCNDDGDLELLTALEFEDGVDWIYSGGGQTHRKGLGSSFYSSSFWNITAMAGGDYDGDGGDELITTFEGSDKTRIYSGDGTTSPNNLATLMSDEVAPYWKITAQTSGNFGGGNDEVITAMNAVGSTSSTYKVYSGNGVSQAATTALHTSTTSPFWQTTATVAGDFNNNGTEELITGMYQLGASPSYKIYIGNGTSTVANTALVSSSSPLFVRAAGGADYNGDGDLDLITAIHRPGTSPALKILVGNGSTSHSNLGTLYSSTYMD